MGLLSVLITLLAWGTWLAPSQRVPMKGQQTRTFYVTLAALLMAIVVACFRDVEGLNMRTIWFPFVGGVIWAISGQAAFVSTDKLGIAKAVGIWTPMNMLVSVAWGVILFGEFLHKGTLSISLAFVALVVIIAGVLLIIFAGAGGQHAERVSRDSLRIGIMGALGAGVGWGSYFIPLQLSGISMWVGMLPLAAGMFAGGIAISALSRTSVRLEGAGQYARVLTTGALWSIGNYGALVMMERIGTGKGFTISQLSVIVNASIGVFWEHRPEPKTKAAKLTLLGIAIAAIGGVLLGTLK